MIWIRLTFNRKPLSFHAVSFGTSNTVLRRMVQIALPIQQSAPPDVNAPAAAMVDSSYSEALDSVRPFSFSTCSFFYSSSGETCGDIPWAGRIVEEDPWIPFAWIDVDTLTENDVYCISGYRITD